ncbi:hemolysin expression modulator Hha [Escherichia coli]|uniref:hemolysin expression modulator Hha n=5 Tax=Escherichia coli TaxID=562 RepID=UPI0024477B95|nr:hemolysin expression modulator Hha [Escherichia coli]
MFTVKPWPVLLDHYKQFRRCSSRETLEKVISHTRYKLTSAELEAFNSVVDHWLAELTMNKLYDRVPASVWKYVI